MKMRKKHKRQLLIAAVAYLFLLGQVAAPRHVLAAASGNYTDLLPIGAASDTTVISRGTGWAIATLPTSQTFGDALSRLNYTAFQSTSVATLSNSTTPSTFTALSGMGTTGSRTFPTSWIQTGRTIRVTVAGRYTTTNPGPTWTWGVALGTTTILTTGALSAPGGQTNKYFRAVALLTIAATGASGTVNGSYDISFASGSVVSSPIGISTVTASAVSVNLGTDSTAQNVVNPTFLWGTADPSNSIQVNNSIVEFLN